MIWVGSEPPQWVTDRWAAWDKRTAEDGWKLRLWVNDDVMEKLPLSAALRDDCPHPAIWSDFARIEAVSLYGGVYVDTDTWPLNPLTGLAGRMRPFVATDLRHGRQIVCNGAFGSAPGSRFLARVWDLSVERLHSPSRPKRLHFIAGPHVWQQAAKDLQLGVDIMPSEAFIPMRWRQRYKEIPKAVANLEATAKRFPRSYCIHEYEQSWNVRTHPIYGDQEMSGDSSE